jgi:hypothetical protein
LWGRWKRRRFDMNMLILGIQIRVGRMREFGGGGVRRRGRSGGVLNLLLMK